jgi:hypothetical protein
MKAKARLRAVDRGFRSMTLDPSPRLRHLRKQGKSHRPMAEAWTVTSRSMAEAAHILTRG